MTKMITMWENKRFHNTITYLKKKVHKTPQFNWMANKELIIPVESMIDAVIYRNILQKLLYIFF